MPLRLLLQLALRGWAEPWRCTPQCLREPERCLGVDAMPGRIRLVRRRCARCQGVVPEDLCLELFPSLRAVPSRWVQPRQRRLSPTHPARQGVMRRVEVFEHLVHGGCGHGPIRVLLGGVQPGHHGGLILRERDRRPQTALDGRSLGVVREEAALCVAVGGGHRPVPCRVEEARQRQADRAVVRPGPLECAMPRAQTLSHTTHARQEWRGTSGARTQAHTHPNTPARSGGAQPKPEPKHTHPRRKPQPQVAGYKRSAHTNTHTAQHPSQEWRGAAKTRARAHTPTPQTPARSGGVEAERAHKHTHGPTPQPGVAGRSQNPSPSTHTHAAHPRQKWRGTSRARKKTHTQPNTPARSGGAQPKPEPKHTHPRRTPQPGVAGYKRSAHTSTHTAQHPSQEWRGAAETRARAHTPKPHRPVRSGGVQAERAHKHTHTPTPQPGLAGHSRNPSPNTHTNTAHPSQEWRGTSGARTRTHAHPNTPVRRGGAQPTPQPKHTHPRRTPQPGVAGYKRSAHTSTHTAQHPSQEWRGAAETGAQTHTPTPHTPARSGGVQAERAHKHIHTPTPKPEVAGRSRNPSPSTTQTQTQAPHNTRKPSVHGPGTEAARAMQVTRPNEIRSPGVRLHPKACVALGLEAERATPKHLGTPVPRTCMHALGTGYARKSGEAPGFRSKEGTCASTGAHPPGETSTSRWRRSALPVLPGAALLGGTSQV